MDILFFISCICLPSCYEDGKQTQTLPVPIQQSGNNEQSVMIAGETLIASPVSSKSIALHLVKFGHVCLLYPTGIKIVQVDYESNYHFRFFSVMFILPSPCQWWPCSSFYPHSVYNLFHSKNSDLHDHLIACFGTIYGQHLCLACVARLI